jgi:hypothetical protein
VAAGSEVTGDVFSKRRCSRGRADRGCLRKMAAIGLLRGPPRDGASLGEGTTCGGNSGARGGMAMVGAWW